VRRPCLKALTLSAALALALPAGASHAITQFGEPKYPANFTHFDYVNPDAPKGGVLNLSTISVNSSVDKYNPFSMKGKVAPGLSELVFETLTIHSLDEQNVQYGLLAEDIEVAPDLSAATFRLRASARFSNGDPVTAEDVKYSFTTLVSPKASPRFKSYFADVARVVVVDARSVRFEFKRKGRDLPFIAGSLPVFSPKWGVQPDGARVAFDKLQLERPIASGPYVVDRSASGQNVVYTRNPGYWGKDIAVRRGSFNFDRVVYKLYKDIDTQVAAMRAGDFDFLSETKMRYWCCQFIGKRFDDGVLLKRLFPHKNPRPMNGYIFNLRRAPFQDVRVRQAFNFAYDWEWLNAMIFDNQFERQDGYFANSPLAARGSPSPAELALLEPFRAELDSAVFGPMFKQPSTSPPGSYRDNLRKAAQLLAAAGWRNRGDGVLRNGKGQPLVLNVSGQSSLLDAFFANLKKLGVQVVVRNSDPAVDRENLRTFNFDFTSIALREARSPGPELLRSFHSASADVNGSENLLGLKSKAVDFLIERILDAGSEEELETAAHAFDRVMVHEAYVLPWRYLKNHYLMYNKRLKYPARLPDYYGAYEWVLGQWWVGGA
jgi:peptide/nickel transport system substrate-binding protein/microcin C transport system substrate-binding protein